MWRLNRTIACRYDVSQADAGKIVRWVEARSQRLMALCGVAGLVGFAGYIELVSGVLHLCESSGVRPLAWLPDSVTLTCAFSLGPGMAIACSALAGSLLRRKLLLARVNRGYGRSECFGCGYSLVGLRRGRERITCPECGEIWPPVGEAPGREPRGA